jgi:hypothetical protein
MRMGLPSGMPIPPAIQAMAAFYHPNERMFDETTFLHATPRNKGTNPCLALAVYEQPAIRLFDLLAANLDHQ